MIIFNHELILLSDAGFLVRMMGPDRSLSTSVTVSGLPGSCGESIEVHDSDSEALALTPDGQGLSIALETANTLCSGSLSKPESAKRVPVPAMAAWPRNSGAEAMASLPGRGMVIIGDVPDQESGTTSLLWYSGDPADPQTPLFKMRYLPPHGYTAADAAFLPDGRMLVLNRRFNVMSGYTSKLTISERFDGVEGATLTGRVLAQIDDSRIAANYEGMAIEPKVGGTTIWLVSDNNFFPLRSTKLLRLDLDERE